MPYSCEKQGNIVHPTEQWWKLLGRIPLEGEHLHPYTLGTVSEDKCHGKEQIYARTKNPDCTGINQNQHKHGRIVPKTQRQPANVS